MTTAHNIVALRPSDVAGVLEAAIDDREPCMLVGPPGCGKSDIVGQAAEAKGADIFVNHSVLDDPTDGKGMPWFEQGKPYAEFFPFHNLYKVLTATKPTVVFEDDFGQAPPAVQASKMQPILAREVAGRKIPDCVTFVLATNRRTDKAGVSGILEPVKGRLTIIHMESNLEDFCENLYLRGHSYGLTDEMISVGVAYLNFRPDALNEFEATADMTNSPNERNWVKAFKHASKNNPGRILHALIAGRVGAGRGAEFHAFLKTYRDLPSVKAIIADPMNAMMPTEPSAKYAVAVAIAQVANEQNFERIAQYATRFYEAKMGEIATLMVRDCLRKCPKIQSTNAFIKLAALSGIGKLMVGRAA